MTDRRKKIFMPLNHLKMLNAIGRVLWENPEFLADMEWKEQEKKTPYTQEEAKKMSQMLGNIYMIAHALWCSGCAGKWRQKVD